MTTASLGGVTLDATNDRRLPRRLGTRRPEPMRACRPPRTSATRKPPRRWSSPWWRRVPGTRGVRHAVAGPAPAAAALPEGARRRRGRGPGRRDLDARGAGAADVRGRVRRLPGLDLHHRPAPRDRPGPGSLAGADHGLGGRPGGGQRPGVDGARAPSRRRPRTMRPPKRSGWSRPCRRPRPRWWPSGSWPDSTSPTWQS